MRRADAAMLPLDTIGTARGRRLVVVQRAARTVQIVAIVLAGLITFKVIPPPVDLRPPVGSVRDYVAWWLMGVAMIGEITARTVARRRRIVAR